VDDGLPIPRVKYRHWFDL